MKLLPLILMFLVSLFSRVVCSAEMPVSASPEGAKAYIISPADGAAVASPVTVQFGLGGMGVAPAGTDRANTGHHHLLVDGKMLPAAGKPMGAEVTHFGGGQTQTTVELTPGEHTLQLILGDKNHVQHKPPVVSEKVTITVK